MAVTVKLNDEEGAAGLVFGADAGDKHYGFYPSGGKLRLIRFEGPDVFSWKILHDLPSRLSPRRMEHPQGPHRKKQNHLLRQR